jgi:hypothetical protein
MTTFDDREKAFEKKYVMDEELSFKIQARRNKLLGLWAADLMGKTSAEAEAYAKEVVLSEYEEAGDQDVERKVWKDLEGSAVSVTRNELRAKMDALMAEARRQVMEG